MFIVSSALSQCNNSEEALTNTSAKLRLLEFRINELIQEKIKNPELPFLEVRIEDLCKKEKIFLSPSVSIFNDLNYFNEKEIGELRDGNFKCGVNFMMDECPNIQDYYMQLFHEGKLNLQSYYKIKDPKILDGVLLDDVIEIVYRNEYFLEINKRFYRPKTMLARFVIEDNCESSIISIDLAGLEDIKKSKTKNLVFPPVVIPSIPSPISPVAVVSPPPFPNTKQNEQTKKSLPPLIKILTTPKISSDSSGSIKALVENVNLRNINISENGRAVSYQFDSTVNVLNYDYNFRGDNDTIKFLVTHKKLKSIADSITLTYRKPCVSCENENASLYLVVEELKREIDSLNMIIAELRWTLKKKSFAIKKLHDKLTEKETQLAKTEKELSDKKLDLDIVKEELKNLKGSVGESAEKISTHLRELEINITKTIEVYERYDHQKAFFIGLNYTLFNDPFSFKSSEGNGMNIYDRVFQNNLGFSFYHNIGGFVSNVRFRDGTPPKNTYTLVDVQRAKENLFSQNIQFNDVNFVRTAENISTVNAGIYFYPNILKGLYGAVGISRIKGEVWEYYDGNVGDGLIKEENDLYALNLQKLNLNGIYTGIAYVVPWFQVEMGYNWLYKDFNLSLGINYPIGSIGRDKTNKTGQRVYKPRHIKIFNPKFKNIIDTTSISLRYINVRKNPKNLTYRKFQINRIILEGTKCEGKDRDSVKLVVENIMSFYANRDSFPIEWYKENNFDFYQKRMRKFLREQIIQFDLDKVIPDPSIGSKAYRILEYLNLEDTEIKDKLIKLKRKRGALEEVILQETENIKENARKKSNRQNK